MVFNIFFRVILLLVLTNRYVKSTSRKSNLRLLSSSVDTNTLEYPATSQDKPEPNKQAGCCSLNYKDCDGTFCGETESQCLSCVNGNNSFSWLPSGPILNSCLAKWADCTNDINGCCSPGVCITRQEGYKRCEPELILSEPPLVTHSSTPSVTPCDPIIEYCEFTSSFEVDLGQSDSILDDNGAQSSFSIAARNWINECYEDNYDTDVVYYSFYFAKSEAKSRGRTGLASGQCKGYDCPKSVSFSAPTRRKNSRKEILPKNGITCPTDILEALKSEDPVFLKVEEIRMEIPNDNVEYEVADDITTPQSATAQRNASISVLEALGLGINETTHECLWEGTTCNADRNIASIRLRVNQLGTQFRGTIASELGSLEYLEYFDISGNSINGIIPTELGLLKNVDTLALSYNDLTSRIPTELGLLQNIETLKIDNNALTGTVPNELALLTNLEMLYLSENDLTGPTTHVCFPSEKDFDCPDDDVQDAPDTAGQLESQILAIVKNLLNFMVDIIDYFRDLLPF